MLNLEKYAYPLIPRKEVNGVRHYAVMQGQEEVLLPSVTTILSSTKQSESLDAWKDRVGEIKAEKIKEESSRLGSEMHLNLENYIFGRPVQGSYLSRVMSGQIIKYAFPRINEIWGSEVALYYPGLYAGTTDLVGLHNNEPAIMDFKSTNTEKDVEWIEDYFLQLAAYAMAHNELYGTTIRRGVIMMCSRAGKYQEFIIEGQVFDRYLSLWHDRLSTYYNIHSQQ